MATPATTPRTSPSPTRSWSSSPWTPPPMSTCTTNGPSATRPKAGSQASTPRFTASTFARPTSPSPTGRARRPVILPLSRGRRGRAMYERPAAFTGSLRFGATSSWRSHQGTCVRCGGTWRASTSSRRPEQRHRALTARARSARHAVPGVEALPRRSVSCGL